ncbi:hypothetical protein [Pedobacter sp. B4-66]|uniref:hypothetical protein n=1 Tax=Pedobacter sp. B4-66 TaxID=2817280 RepID=UPI001BDA7D39|nr:hypothetical protein [Pedobacter sp. B4-66]
MTGVDIISTLAGRPSQYMGIIDKLAHSLGRRDEIPNQELANAIVQANDSKAVEELIENLYHKNKDIQSDCIKVIYEIGTVKPELIADFSNELTTLLDHKNNRLQWGTMMALNTIVAVKSKVIYEALPKIIDVADKGSVITNDHCVGIMIKLCAIKEYSDDVFLLLNERLLKSPDNQLPMYAENALPVINAKNNIVFVNTLLSRIKGIEKESKRARVEKVIRKVNKMFPAL